MKKKTVLVHPCPKCGSNFLAHGKPYGCTTPRILAWLGSLHGVICVSCGHYLEREFIHRQLATGQPLHLNI